MDEEFFTNSRRLVEAAFYANGTWIAPATTTQIEYVVGRGQDGTPGGVTAASVVVAIVNWLVGGSGPFSGVVDWSSPQGAANTALAAINAGGSVAWTEYQVGQYDNGTYILGSYPGTYGSVQPGTASLSYTAGWQSSGPITGGVNPGSQQGWYATVNFTYVASSSTTGADATAFGCTFPGGIAGPATPAVFFTIPVTPGASYSIVAPPGAVIAFNYFE